MSEWLDKYNPFNSWKALVHADKFEAILEGKPKSPIVVNMDLTNACNYSCGFCMFGGARERADKSGEVFRKGNSSLEVGYAPTLPKLWKEWGVKAVCLAGGGEPSLHPDFKPFIEACGREGLDLGVVSNGYLINNTDIWETINRNAKFVGFSMDAGTPEAYSAVKGVPRENYQKVLKNLEGLANTRERLGTDLQIGYKFVLDRENWGTIYEAARIAKKHGANQFHFRPAIDPDHKYFADKINTIQEQISMAQKDLNSDDYHVYGVMHKFNKDLSKKHDFEKCRATQLTSTWCADGNVYMCTDTRGCDWSKLGEHYPDPKKFIESWGDSQHLKRVNDINFKRDCDRCTLAPYNEMFEQVFINDKMDKNLI